VTVLVGVLLIVLFGIISLQQIPIQLSPTVQEPEITVDTIWPGATPYEVERDIIEEQEKVLKGIPGLYEMEGTAQNGRAQITLRFKIGTDLESVLLRVSNKLDEVPTYPENVDKPIINASGAESSPVMWIVLKTLEGNDSDIYTYRTFLENDLRQYFDRVEGVSDLLIGGGVLQEMHVRISPESLARYGLTIDQVVTALRAENANVSAGNLDVGRNDYRIRTVAEYRSPEDITNVIIYSDGQRRITVGDLATVGFGFERLNTPMLNKGVPGIAIGVRPEPNANILELTDRVEEVIIEVNASMLKDMGLYLDLVNEQRPYIRGAIDLLKQNIAIGGILAVIVLLIYLRAIAPTIVVGTTIPISIIGTFSFMYALGSTLNVVSLAGIAFAVGMLVDNAIVVLENIDRHKSMGKSAFAAAYDGAREVWGAVMASTLTTVAVFLPVIFLEDEAGQLFKDIALAVTSAVLISLISSITVIPMLSRILFGMVDRRAQRKTRRAEKKAKRTGKPVQPRRRLNALGHVGSALAGMIMLMVRASLFHWTARLVTIILLAGGAVFTAWTLLPKMEYLPQGNRDLIINIMIPPPGLSYEERMGIGKQIFSYLDPHFDGPHDGKPQIRNAFFVGRGGLIILGVISADQARTKELIPLCQAAMAQIPGIFGISNQASIFESGLGQGRTISVDLSGPSIEDLVSSAGMLMGKIRGAIPETQIRPVPALDMLYPEANFIPDREKLRAVGMSAQQLGLALDVLMDGRDIGDFKQEGEKKIDLVLKGSIEDIASPEDLYEALIVTPLGETMPVNELARLERTGGLTEIRHLERNRTVSLQVTPPYEITIQEAMERINDEIVPEMQAAGLLEDITIGMSGTADKLVETGEALQWNFLVAALICYLLMSALLGNFLYPIIIMFTVPLAAAGGLIGLNLVNYFIAPQQLDVLTMLGFIILIGVVVNNAILIVYQSLNNIRYEYMEHNQAVLESVRTRLRPIYMSATTSVFGMLPLVLWPGPGSELYRGLGSVVLGGLALSTVFTVFLIPSLLMFVIHWERLPERPAEPVPSKGSDTPEVLPI
jgi:HAE1 family hydrophobic/amphiphilic exporter-1